MVRHAATDERDELAAGDAVSQWLVNEKGYVPSLVEGERRPLGVYATAFCWSSVPS